MPSLSHWFITIIANVRVDCHREVRCFWRQRLQTDGQSVLGPNYLAIMCTRGWKLVKINDLAMVDRIEQSFCFDFVKTKDCATYSIISIFLGEVSFTSR